jgi:uncharacterized protein involved in outer membrane biogenesis
MKKWIVRIVIVGVLVVILAVAAAFFFLGDIIKKGVETAGPQLTKTETRLSKATLSPFTGGAEMNGLFVGNPQGFKSEAAIKVGDVKVKLDPKSVFSDVVVIESIHIEAPEITYETGLAGSNIGKILDNVEAAGGGASSSEPPPPTTGSSKKFRVKDIQINGAKVTLSVPGLKPVVVPLENLRVQNIGTDGSGVNAAQLTREVLKPLLASVTKAATQANIGGQLKDATKSATEQLDQTTKGLKGLLPK